MFEYHSMKSFSSFLIDLKFGEVYSLFYLIFQHNILLTD
jgi:hypothetical protein